MTVAWKISLDPFNPDLMPTWVRTAIVCGKVEVKNIRQPNVMLSVNGKDGKTGDYLIKDNHELKILSPEEMKAEYGIYNRIQHAQGQIQPYERDKRADSVGTQESEETRSTGL